MTHRVQVALGARRGWLLALALGAWRPAWAAGALSLDRQLSFERLYKSVGVLGLRYADQTLALVGQEVTMRGFMAPPLKPDSRFFVLTRNPVAVCPFCSSDAQWPVDIVVVYLRDTLEPVDFSRPVEVRGKLEIGSWTDPQTGFVSQVRIVAARLRS